MDHIIVAEQLSSKIAEIDIIRKEIKERGEQKSQKITDYERGMAIVIIKLENGVSFNLDGEEIKNPSKSILEKVAKGICWQEKLEMEKADANYKSIITNLQAVMAQLNALQSLNRYLE